MDIDYSPTGREFVTGSYDRTVGCLAFAYNHFLHCLIYESFNVKLNLSFAGENIPV